MGELRSQDLTIAGWIINLPLATVGHHTGGPGIGWTGPGSRGLFPRESRRIKVKVKLINQRETEEKLLGARGGGGCCGRRQSDQDAGREGVRLQSVSHKQGLHSKSISAACLMT